MRSVWVRWPLAPTLVFMLQASACHVRRALPPPATADEATPGTDAAVPGDGGLLPDLTARPDLPDLAVTPDLPSQGDLSGPLDGLPAPPDLVTPGDLGTSPDLGFGCAPSGAPPPTPIVPVQWFVPVRTFLVDRALGVPDSVAIGDVTGDGRNDVVVTLGSTSGSGTVEVRPQVSSGQLGTPVHYTVGPFPSKSPLAIGDLNHDGRLDVVVGQMSGIGVMLQNAQGTLDPPRLYAASAPYVIAVGDFNHDGLTDVASLDWSGPAIEIHLQDPQGGLRPSVAYRVPHYGFDDLAAGDVNGDGLADLVVGDQVIGGEQGLPSFPVLLQRGDGTLASPVFYPLPAAPRGIAVGDVTGDCRGDVVITYGGSRPGSFIASFAEDAGGGLAPAVSVASYDMPSDVAIADVDGDGAGDVVVLHAGGPAMLGVYRQSPGSLLAPEVLYDFGAVNAGPQKLAVGDINGDGRPDVVSGDDGGLFVLYHQ